MPIVVAALFRIPHQHSPTILACAASVMYEPYVAVRRGGRPQLSRAASSSTSANNKTALAKQCAHNVGENTLLPARHNASARIEVSIDPLRVLAILLAVHVELSHKVIVMAFVVFAHLAGLAV